MHCAATLVVRRPEAALDEIEALRGRRIAGLYAVRPGSDEVTRISAILDLTAGELDLEPGEGWGFAHLNEAVLQGISDTHRGETVLILVGEEHPVEPIEIEIGDNGVSVRQP